MPDEKVITDKWDKLTSPAELLDSVEDVLDDWIVVKTTQASCDLVKINQQWADFCRHFKCEPQEVILVKNSYFRERMDGKSNPKHQLYYSACDNLSRLGFLVRDKEHFDLCKGCNELIVADWILKQNNIPVMYNCGNCLATRYGKKIIIEKKEETK